MQVYKSVKTALDLSSAWSPCKTVCSDLIQELSVTDNGWLYLTELLTHKSYFHHIYKLKECVLPMQLIWNKPCVSCRKIRTQQILAKEWQLNLFPCQKCRQSRIVQGSWDCPSHKITMPLRRCRGAPAVAWNCMSLDVSKSACGGGPLSCRP